MDSVEELSLVFALDNEHALRATYVRCYMARLDPLPEHLTPEQRKCAHQQDERDIRIIYGQLIHAANKLRWEEEQKWRGHSTTL
jgi:hypothetical protein